MLKRLKKSITTSFWVLSAPKSWSKYTTSLVWIKLWFVGTHQEPESNPLLAGSWRADDLSQMAFLHMIFHIITAHFSPAADGSKGTPVWNLAEHFFGEQTPSTSKFCSADGTFDESGPAVWAKEVSDIALVDGWRCRNEKTDNALQSFFQFEEWNVFLRSIFEFHDARHWGLK